MMLALLGFEQCGYVNPDESLGLVATRTFAFLSAGTAARSC
jgi:hypothetical protein